MSLTNKITIETKTSPLCEEEHLLLHQIAKHAVEYGLQHNDRLPIDTARYPRPLRELGASFVTLKNRGSYAAALVRWKHTGR